MCVAWRCDFSFVTACSPQRLHPTPTSPSTLFQQGQTKPRTYLGPVNPRRRQRGILKTGQHVVSRGAMSCWPLLLLVLLGCSASSLQTPSQRRPYDRESSSLHPDVTVHRKLYEEVVDVYVSISREELLYSRLDSRSPFVAQLQITVEDTTWHVLDTAWADAPPHSDRFGPTPPCQPNPIWTSK